MTDIREVFVQVNLDMTDSMHRTGTKHIVRHMQKSVIQWSVISKFTCNRTDEDFACRRDLRLPVQVHSSPYIVSSIVFLGRNLIINYDIQNQL